MHIIFFLEEPSVEEALDNLVPRILGEGITWQFITFQGKPDLLDHLVDRLRGYAGWLPDDFRVVVLVDEDRQDCHELKHRLENAARDAGLITKTHSEGRVFQVLNRIAVEELEAWFFGDVQALCQAFPRLPARLGHRQSYRDPDHILGGTWEALEKLLQRHNYYSGGLPKSDAAKEISQYMQPERNRSHSFQVFCRGLQAL